MHTDNNVDPDNHTRKGIIGCGHLAQAATKNLCSEYDVTSQDVLKLVDYARNIAEISANLEMVNLHGEHAEAGVLVIKSKRYSVNSEDPDLKKMYFIYDEERDNDFLKKLVNQMAIPGVTFADMKKESDLQLQATLNNLAAGLPVYSVEFHGRKPVVYFLSFISDFEKKRYFHMPSLHFPQNLLPRFR
jgi:hypothetical protein